MNPFEELNKDEALEDGSMCYFQRQKKSSTGLDYPLLICFHGSGVLSWPTWLKLLDLLGDDYQILIADRGLNNPSPKEHVKAMLTYLARHNLQGPYILIAHSYGGVFACHFLQQKREAVAGLILAETGKAVGADDVTKLLFRKRFLDPAPLSVIKGNSLLRFGQTSSATNTDSTKTESTSQPTTRPEWISAAEEMDKKFEKEQLLLSGNNKYVYLPECGHNVIADRPDVVVQELGWVIDNMRDATSNTSWLQRLQKLLQHNR